MFNRKNDILQRMQGGINRESLLVKWKNLVTVVMQYITLENQTSIIHSFNFAFLNIFRRGKEINIPLYLFHSLQKSILKLNDGKLVGPRHQGLLYILFNHEASNRPKPKPSIGLHYEDSDEESEEKEAKEPNAKEDEDFIILIEDDQAQEEDFTPKKETTPVQKNPMLKGSRDLQSKRVS